MIKLFEFLNNFENKKTEWLPSGKHKVYLYDFKKETKEMNLKEKTNINVITVTFKSFDSFKNAISNIQIILDEEYIDMAKNSTNAEFNWRKGAETLQILLSKTNIEAVNNEDDILKALEQLKGNQTTLFNLKIFKGNYGVIQTLSY